MGREERREMSQLEGMAPGGEPTEKFLEFLAGIEEPQLWRSSNFISVTFID